MRFATLLARLLPTFATLVHAITIGLPAIARRAAAITRLMPAVATLVAATTMLLPALAAAQDADHDDVRLDVKPVLCVTDNRNPSCELSFLVVWESRTTGYYCVFNDFGDDPLRCWSEERMGRMTDDRTIDEGFTFWMTSEDLARRLAEVDVEVLRLDSDDRRRSRRTRHVWDIN